MDIKMNEDITELLSTVSSIAQEKLEILSARENEIYLRISKPGLKRPALHLRKGSLA